MSIENTIKLYLKTLGKGDYEEMMKLFTPNAIVDSPLMGKKKASEFYADLFKVTTISKLTLLNVFKKGNVGAAHFRYDWILKDGTPTYFEVVDIFTFLKDKIKHLKIIYDTQRTRSAFERNKK